jgi:hypothetical protein
MKESSNRCRAMKNIKNEAEGRFAATSILLHLSDRFLLAETRYSQTTNDHATASYFYLQ